MALSARQTEIADMIVGGGKSAREIALALTLSPRTVETHIAAIYHKFGVSSRAELVAAFLGPAASSLQSAANSAQTNLPVRRARLLGRETDVANIIGLLRAGRLVTIAGPGGIGKTSTALVVSETVLPDTAGGVWYIELAAHAPGSSLESALARALGIAYRPGTSAIETLCAHVARKTLTIVFDNCEHLIREVAAVADALLPRCPHLRILATSREPLRIAGERTYRLPALGVPTAQAATELGATAAARYAALQLFAARAQGVQYEFTLTDENTPIVAEICRRLDGIPLAIELAAARVNVLGVHALAMKLPSQLRLLSGGDRTALPRQRTMHALIDWSYDLLTPAEQRLFERLSVFAGGCALREALAVYDDPSMDEIGLLDIMASLVDKSLVVADSNGPETRYGLLQTFAQYGLDKLALHGTADAAARCHARAYLDLAHRLDIEHDAAPSTSWDVRSGCEIQNWLAALAWTLEARHDVLAGQRLVAALRHVWLNTEGAARWLLMARQNIAEHTPADVVAALDFTAAFVDFAFGENEGIITVCRRLGKTYEALGDALKTAYLGAWEGAALVLLGRWSEAEARLDRSLITARSHGRSPLVAYVLQFVAHVSFARGDIAAGRAQAAEGIAIYESLGAELRAAIARANLAEAECACGNIDAAMQLAFSSLTAVRQFGSMRNIAVGLNNVATYCIAADRWRAAHEHTCEAVRIAAEMRHHVTFSTALHNAAAIAALASGNAAQPATAARLLGHADACVKRLGYVRESIEQRQYERVLAALRVAYTDDELASHLAEGAALSAQGAVELALSLSRPESVRTIRSTERAPLR